MSFFMVRVFMQFIDTHIHLQDFKADFAPRVLENLNFKRLVLVSAKEADFMMVADLAKRYPAQCVPAFGIHPWYAKDGVKIELLRQYLKRFSKALVGEIGVDGLRGAPNEAQHEIFLQQLMVAKEFSRPVIVHAAKAFVALNEHKKALYGVRFVYHGFVKNRELIKFINSCGGYFGLGTHFLLQEKAAEMWAEMPKNRVLFETDAPYQVKEETYANTVRENLRKLAKISQTPMEELAELLLHNTEEFLRC